jgi:hypothetical protein
MRLRLSIIIAFLAFAPVSRSLADLIICPSNKNVDDSEKPSAQFIVPDARRSEFETAVHEYAVQKHLTFLKRAQLGGTWNTMILRAPDSGNFLWVREIEGDKLVVVGISRNCVPDKDWRPYWRNFGAFIDAHGFRRASG